MHTDLSSDSAVTGRSTGTIEASGSSALGQATPQKVSGLEASIGNTPLVPLHNLARLIAAQSAAQPAISQTTGTARPTATSAHPAGITQSAAEPRIRVHAKLESFNPGGSAKDRTAQAMIARALRKNQLADQPVLVESSSGNLGMALARQAAVRGWEFHCVVDPRVNGSTVATMRAFGAQVHMLDKPDPETGDWLTARRQAVARLVDELPGSVTLDQYSNTAAHDAHDFGTMREVVEQLGHAPDELFVAVSTTGTIGGCQRRIVRENLNTQVNGVDAVGSVLFGGERGDRRLPGYGAGLVPELAHLSHPDHVLRIPDLDAIVGARVLARAEGLLCGASSGAVVAAALQRLPQRAADLTHASAAEPIDAALVFADGGQPYVDTIYNDDWVAATFDISPSELRRRVDSVLSVEG